MSQGAGAGGEGDDKGAESDSASGSAKLPSKRGKGKSKGKVWEKVVWFTRRSRSRDLPSEHGAVADCEAAAFPNDVMDLDVSPTRSLSLHSAITSKSWIESSSSSESELFENEDGYMVKRSRLYPNSEIIEQNCLKPSVARALFLQIEAANHRNGRLQKYSWQRKKKKICSFLNTDLLYNTDIESLSRATSMPSGITSKNTCHCRACCSCAPSEILQGLCPAHARLSTSTTSLDTGLSNLEGLECEFEQKNQKEAEPPEHSNENEQSYQQQAAEPASSSSSSVKTKVSPTLKYYSQSLQRKCKNCGEVIRQSPLPISDSGMLPSLLSQASFCQCKQTYMVPRSEVADESSCSVSSRSHRSTKYPPSDSTEYCGTRSRVEPVEFKSRHDTMKNWFHEFTDDQKNLLLKSLLLECELPQMHLLSLEVEPRLHQGCPPNCQDRLSWLPTPLALHVFSFLDAVSLCQASSVSRSWYQLATEPSLWRRFCYHSKWQLSTNGEQKQLIHHMMPNGNIHWKKVFSERYRLRNNWLRGKCNVRTFEGHTQGISCVQFDDTRIVSGSHDKTIKVWNIRTNSPWSVQTLVGHSGTVRCLHLEGNRLVSGSTDRTIKVWDLSMQQSWSSIACKVTMIGHTDTVRCLQVDDDKVISGSYDKTLKVWDIRTGHCRMTLRGHDAAVLCVQFDDAKIVSGSCDKTIKVWNFTGSCMTTLHGHHDAVTCLQFDDTRIVSGSLDCNLKFWDVHTGTCMNTIDWKASEGHTGVVRCLQADSWRVVSASDDRTLKVWSLETGLRLVTLRNHTDGVTCLQFNDSIIVSGSYDKTVKLWDFSCC